MNLDWMDRAKCRHPSAASKLSPRRDGKNAPDMAHAAATAARYCGKCPVLADCLGFTAAKVAAGLRPQDLVQAGKYWPPAASNGAAKPPTDLLVPDGERITEDTAA